jgi:hypothetical protein
MSVNIQPVSLAEFNPAKLTFSPVTPAEGKADAYTRPLYDGRPLALSVEGLKSYKGVIRSKFNTYFANFYFLRKGDNEQARKLESALIQRMFDFKTQLFPTKAAKIMSPEFLDMQFTNRLVTEGRDKGDGSGSKYDDQLTVSFPSKKINKNDATIDEEAVTIMNADAHILGYQSVQAKPVLSMGILFDKITLGGEIKLRASASYIVLDAPPPVRVLPPMMIQGVKRVMDDGAPPVAQGVKRVMDSADAPPVAQGVKRMTDGGADVAQGTKRVLDSGADTTSSTSGSSTGPVVAAAAATDPEGSAQQTGKKVKPTTA